MKGGIAKRSILVRSALPSELLEVALIARQCFPESFASERSVSERLARGSVLFVAEVGVDIAGFIELRLGVLKARVVGLATKPSFRGMGVASTLLDYSLKLAKGLGKRSLSLKVSAKNPRALSLYQKHGFAVLGKRVLKGGGSAYAMARIFET
jgi:ribosomal protein S18 acetylase RimI-like enzyme